MMNNRQFLSIFLAFFLFFGSFAWAADNVGQLIGRGEELYQKGDFEHAVLAWEQAAALLNAEQETDTYLSTITHLANAYQAIGYHKRALSALEKTLPIVEKSSDPYTNALFFNCFADLHLSLGEPGKALQYLEKGAIQAHSSKNPYIQASILNNIGNVFVVYGNYPEALQAYEKCLGLMEKFGDAPQLKSKILINIASVGFYMGDYEGAVAVLDNALLQIENLPDSHDKAKNLLSLGELFQQIRDRMSSALLASDDNVEELEIFPPAYTEAYLPDESAEFIEESEIFPVARYAYENMTLWYNLEIATKFENRLIKSASEAFNKAMRIAETLENPRIASYSCGYMGLLYENEGRYSDAVKLTRRAIFFAQQGHFPGILYFWQWQLGRIFKAQDNVEKAVNAYKDSISTLHPIRGELFRGLRIPQDTFNELIKPVYLGLAELLLEQAEKNGGESANHLRREARDTMELLKTAELQDFFKDECSTLMQSEITAPNRTSPHTALIYPIIFSEKLVLLLTLPDGMKQVSVPIDSVSLNETVTRFRMQLQNRLNNRFLYQAEQLYDWIIRPIEEILTAREINTLIIAPDGVFRTIPISALHDGEHFLVETYAVGTIPAITLTGQKLNLSGFGQGKILLSGLSESRQGFSPLPSVSDELNDIKKIMGGRYVLKNNTFTIEHLTDEFRNNDYGIVHIATHGVFGGTPEESFLLTYDNRLTMDGLEGLIGLGRFRKNPVELLTLSACQTALGDERAALGLAGVAVKAGVRSAIATLWYVDDEATSLAIREFYRQLGTPGISKVKALQNAQKKLIAQIRYWHPSYWAPFLLIGNWM